MRVLIDTNILISREEDSVLDEDLQELLNRFSRLNHQVLVHPLSIKELERDADENRKKVQISKMGAYQILEDPPTPNEDKIFLDKIGDTNSNENNHEYVDRFMIYAVYKDAVDFEFFGKVV